MNNIIRTILVLCCLHTSAIYAQNAAVIDSLKVLLKKSTKAQKIDHFIALADVYEKAQNRNLDSALYFAEQAIRYSEQYKKPLKRIEALYVLGWVKLDIKNNEEGRLHFEEVLAKSKKLSYIKGTRKGNLGIGSALVAKGEVEKAIPYFERAYELAKEQENQVVIVEMAVLLSRWSKTKKALELLESVVLVIEDPSIPLATKCLFYIRVAEINSSMGRFEKTLEQYKMALGFAEQDDHIQYQFRATLGIGHTYTFLSEKRDYNKALHYILQANGLVDQHQELASNKGRVLNHIAYNYNNLKEYKKAIDYAEKALAIFQDGDPVRYGEVLQHLGNAYMGLGQTPKANTYFTEASKLYLKMIEKEKSVDDNRSKELIGAYYLLLSDLAYDLGDFKESLEHHKLHVAYKDSVSAETNIKISERLEFAKQTAEKNTEISYLALENSKQRSQRQSLIIGLIFISILLAVLFNRFRLKQRAYKIIKEKNEENTLLMREIHHRVKNNLQIILSLLRAQISNHDENKELQTALIESQHKIQSMALIHQNLYQGDNFTKVHVNSYIRELVDNLQKSFSKVLKFEMDIDHKEIEIELAIPLGLIVNELITNCFKYAFSDHEKNSNNVKISFKQTDQPRKFQLLIKDNGKGLPENFDLNVSSSFGMQLVHGLVDQLQGKIKILQEKGTAFEIYLEEPKVA